MSVNLSAPPRDGQANQELEEYMGEVLGLKKNQVQLVSGGKNRNKVIGVDSGAIRDQDVARLIQEEYNS